jgi:hypothetical protein
MDEEDGPLVFAHACKLGLEGIVSKRRESFYSSGRSPHWIKTKNPQAPAVKREAEEDWGGWSARSRHSRRSRLRSWAQNMRAGLGVDNSVVETGEHTDKHQDRNEIAPRHAPEY